MGGNPRRALWLVGLPVARDDRPQGRRLVKSAGRSGLCLAGGQLHDSDHLRSIKIWKALGTKALEAFFGI